MSINNWYTFKSASEKIGKSPSYFYMQHKRHPSYFKEGTYKKEGRIWFISDEGIEHVLELKKAGDHQKPVIFSGLQSKSSIFAFTLNCSF